jgi:hypothetical protein
MKKGDRVRLKTFNGQKRPNEEVDEKENYWKLIDKLGIIEKDPKERSIFASFSIEPRILVRFENDVKSLNLECHNAIENSLWILVSDLEVIRNDV